MKVLKHALTKIIPQGIWFQVGLVFTLILIGSLLVLGYSLIRTSRQAVKDSVLRDREEISRGAAREISSFIDKAQDRLVNTAGMLSTITLDDIDAQQVLAYQLITDGPTLFEGVSLVSLTGQELVSSGWSNKPKAYAQSEVFQQVVTTQEPAMSPAHFSEEHFPYMTMAVPIRKLNKLSRVLIAEVKLSGVWSILARIKSAEDQIFLVDEAGYVLVHNEQKEVYRGSNLKHSRVVQEVLQGRAGSREEKDVVGEWLSAYAPISPLGWGLVIRQPLRIAYAFSSRMQRTALVLIAGALLIAVLLTLLIAHRIVRPIRELTRVTARVAAGDLDQSIKSERQDEVGRLLTAFDKMIQELKKARKLEKLSNIGLATSKIAHELRNPLVALKTFMQLLPRRHKDEKFVDQFQETVPDEMNRLETMLGTLTDFSRIQKLRLASCDMVALIRESLKLFQEQMAQNKVSISACLEPEQLSLVVDCDKIKQVFVNLIRNAVEAMPEGGALNINAKICLDGRNLPAGPAPDEQKVLEIEVKDTGCGMDRDKLSRVFEPFHTDKRGGLGLGLSICKEIIEQHRGTIEVASQAGQGTVFTIKFPVRS